MPEATIFKYERPDLDGRKKRVVRLARTEVAHCNGQVVGEGGETNLHSHTFLDGFWFVLNGRARFYTSDNEMVAELGPMEGIVIPHEYPYWFERVGDELLELLQFEASVPRDPDDDRPDRVDHEPRKRPIGAAE